MIGTSDLTRRQFLRSAALGTAGLAFAGAAGELITGAFASTASPPRPPRWHSRPDLKIPGLTVVHSDPAASRDPIFIAPYNAPNDAQAGAVIVARDGEPIWENPLANLVTTNFHVQTYQGRPVLTWWQGIIELGHGVGEYVIADPSYRTLRTVQAKRGLRADLHEFVITPRDTAIYTSYVVTHADLSSVCGPRNGTIQDAIFQELDLATGEVLAEWHSLEHVSLDESYSPVSSDWDFFHMNSVDVDYDGSLLVSSRSTHTVYKIAPDGEIIWRLGGKRSDFELGPGASFAWQHDARRRPDGTISVFDNGATPAVEKQSRALILDVDERAMTANLLEQYTHPRVLAGSQGNVQLLDNGNVFVGWGEVPRVSEFERSGRMVFDALLGKDYECYRAFRMPWRAQPAQAPAIALTRGSGALTAYASWNGATEIARWRLLAGASETQLAPVALARASGFESALKTRSDGPYFAVEALDLRGATLGRSSTITA